MKNSAGVLLSQRVAVFVAILVARLVAVFALLVAADVASRDLVGAASLRGTVATVSTCGPIFRGIDPISAQDPPYHRPLPIEVVGDLLHVAAKLLHQGPELVGTRDRAALSGRAAA